MAQIYTNVVRYFAFSIFPNLLFLCLVLSLLIFIAFRHRLNIDIHCLSIVFLLFFVFSFLNLFGQSMYFNQKEHHMPLLILSHTHRLKKELIPFIYVASSHNERCLKALYKKPKSI